MKERTAQRPSFRSRIPAVLRNTSHYPTVIVLAVGALLLLLEKDLLWKAQEQNLFLDTWLYFKEQWVVPGGFVTWLSTYFTQFFYHPWVGTLLLCGWWFLLMWIVRHAFRLSRQWTMLTLIPVLFLLVTIVDSGYWIYMLKLRGYFFASTIGTTAVAALLWAFRCLPSGGWKRPVFVLLTSLLGYPLLGAYSLAATLLMAVWAWLLERRFPAAATITVIGVAGAILVPLLCYQYVYYQINVANIYFAELPLYYVTEECHSFYVPFYLLALYFLVLILFSRIVSTSATATVSKPRKGRPSLTIRHMAAKPAVVSSVLVVGALVYVVCFWYRDENFHRELAMQHCIERLDWEGVISEAKQQQDEPTRSIVMMRNLALAHLGRQGNEMYHYPNGSKRINAPFRMSLLMTVGPLVYYQYGQTNYCYRLCMEMGVEYGWRVSYLKYMARCALLNGESQLSRKFLNILKHTAFYDKWAEKVEKLVDMPGSASQTPEMNFITHMMHYDNVLTADQGLVEPFLMKQLSYCLNADDPVFQEQTLLATLYSRNVDLFWMHLEDFVRLHPNVQLPVHVQEAFLLYGTLSNHPAVKKWRFDPAVVDNFHRFQQMSSRYNNMDVDVCREALYPYFGDTFYYDYYLMQHLPNY